MFALIINSNYGFKLSDCKEWQWKDVEKVGTLIEKILKFCSIECYWKKYWKVLKICTYWTLLKKYWKILILIEPSIEKVLIIEHYWKINNTFSLLYCIVLYCIEPRRRCLVVGSNLARSEEIAHKFGFPRPVVSK